MINLKITLSSRKESREMPYGNQYSENLDNGWGLWSLMQALTLDVIIGVSSVWSNKWQKWCITIIFLKTLFQTNKTNMPWFSCFSQQWLPRTKTKRGGMPISKNHWMKTIWKVYSGKYSKKITLKCEESSFNRVWLDTYGLCIGKGNLETLTNT